MPRTRVKICGVMRPEDAELAQSAGADAVGMIFHPPARRNIDLPRAREIVSALGPFVTPVGVFVDAPTPTIRHVAETLGLNMVQLHGQETPAQALELRELGIRVIKAIRVDRDIHAEIERWRQLAGESDALLGVVLETAAVSGGSGIANDWSAIGALRSDGLLADLRIIAAGGVTPENVADVIRLTRPWAVDTSSGVEVEFGRKSPEKIHALLAAVAAAYQRINK